MNQSRLFLGCFMALIATAFGFIVRATIMDDWRLQFGLTGTQLGNIGGAGLYPMAISIILFSLIVDKIGYGASMVFAFVGHITSAIITLMAQSYEWLYLGTFIFALSNGVVEAVINPVVATVYDKNKTHWLNILHAGWPGGLVLGGLLSIAISYIPTDALPGALWQWKVGLVLLPTIFYGVLLFGQKFPVQERVATGVSYMDMLREFGAGSCFVVCLLLVGGIDQILGVFGKSIDGVLGLQDTLADAGVLGKLGLYAAFAIVPTLLFAGTVRTFGRPMFVVLLMVMVLLATTELGTDSWIADIMSSVLKSPVAGALVLVYTSFIMFVLRFFAGPIVHVTSPLGLLAASAAIACVGLVWLSNAGEAMTAVFLAATCYGVGKTFFWPTTLGVVSEQYPKGGALMLNAIAGVGMLAVGVVGNPGIGYLQDTAFVDVLKERDPALSAEVTTKKPGPIGEYEALNPDLRTAMRDEVNNLRKETAEQLERETGSRPTPEQVDQAIDAPVVKKLQTIDEIDRTTKQGTLQKIAVLPAIMFVCYLGLIYYFRSRGGYKAEVLTGHAAVDEKFTGGVKAPVR